MRRLLLTNLSAELDEVRFADPNQWFARQTKLVLDVHNL